MKILVTGATGFAGGVITRYLSRQGHEVIATGKSGKVSEAIEKYATFVQLDLREPIPEITVDACIHCAALADDGARYQDLYSANVTGTQNVIAAVMCKTFIYLSSSSVYNFQDTALLEDDNIDISRLDGYGSTKLKAEQLIEKNQHLFLSTYILRPRIIYGIGDRQLLPRIVGAYGGGTIKVPGNLMTQQSFCSANLLAEVVAQLLEKDHKFEIINVCDRHTNQLRDVFNEVLSLYYHITPKYLEIPIPIAHAFARISSILPFQSKLTPMAVENLTKDKILNVDKLNRLVKITKQYAFRDEVRSIVDWLKSTNYASGKSYNGNLAWHNV